MKDDRELAEYRKKTGQKNLVLTRMKGLGEMDAKESTILLDPEKRIMKQVSVDDVTAAERLFEDLMGEAVGPRKEFLKTHSSEVSIHI